jgi:hypothetical protein
VNNSKIVFATLLTIVGVASIHHFGIDGAVVPMVVWLLMPYRS